MEKDRRKHIICPCCGEFFDETEAKVAKTEQRTDDSWKYCPHCNIAIHTPQAQAIGDYMDTVESYIRLLKENKYIECVKYICNLTENKKE